VNADSYTADLLWVQRILHQCVFEDIQRAQAALKNHFRPVENRHYAVAAELVHVSAIVVDDVDLVGDKFAD